MNQSQAYRKKQDLLVNVGAGESGDDGWINIDAFPGKTINCLYDARKRLPFASGSIKGIFSEHFFEHLDYTEEAPQFLRECYRVLQDGGVLRIIVPDAGIWQIGDAEICLDRPIRRTESLYVESIK